MSTLASSFIQFQSNLGLTPSSNAQWTRITSRPCAMFAVPVDKQGNLLPDETVQQHFPNGVQTTSKDEETVLLHTPIEGEHDECFGCCGDWEASEIAAERASRCPLIASRVFAIINAVILFGMFVTLIVTFSIMESDARKYRSPMWIFLLFTIILVIGQIVGAWKRARSTLRATWWCGLILIPFLIAAIPLPMMDGDYTASSIGVAFILFQIPWFIVTSRILGRIAPRCCGCGC